MAQWVGEEVIAGLVRAGFFVIGRHWPGLDGGIEDYGARHGEIAAWLDSLRLSVRPVFYVQSRGGLQLLNYACDEPESFRKIACLYPVTDPRVFPGAGQLLWNAHASTEAMFPWLANTPNLRAARLRGRPIRIWHGDADTLVPKSSTTDVFAPAAGAEVVTIPGLGHTQVWIEAIGDWLRA
ncbi:alpha/beta hydrolase [Pelomonas sp. V22]|uniref:alpha/beta hydrolase family protein n=1 Tax=Pelomonas sp. V22 TaxID=2822139 RepID=UPI0024A9E4BF|nr:alpha/beta hydrolase [Pelomonas sp. V22]MDI4631661.1 alpha/beta hydrolase [Pelomonas sp. V22]